MIPLWKLWPSSNTVKILSSLKECKMRSIAQIHICCCWQVYNQLINLSILNLTQFTLEYNIIHRPVNEWRATTLARTHTRQYLIRCAAVACAKLYIWRVNHAPTLYQKSRVILLQIIHLQLHLKLSFHCII